SVSVRKRPFNVLVLSPLFVLTAFFALTSFWLFARWVYPHVSSVLGGGAPISVQLLLTDAGSTAIHNLPVAVQGGATEHLTLIDRASDHVLLLYADNQVLELSSQNISGIIYNSP